MSLAHAKFAKLARRLIAKHGRIVTIEKLSRTPEDSDKPWRGPDPDPEVGLEYSVPVKGVIVEYDDDQIDDDMIRRSDKRLLVGVPASDPVTDFIGADYVRDGDSIYGIVRVQPVEPGETRCMYDIQIRQ